MRVIPLWNNLRKPGPVSDNPPPPPPETLTNYYFSNLGSDTTGDGTEANPYATISKLSSLTIGAGTGIHFRGGDTFVGPLTVSWSGNSTSNVVVTSYGTGKATIDGGTGNAVVTDQVSYVTVHNIKALGSGRATNTGRGIFVYGGSFVKVTHCRAEGFREGGIDNYLGTDILFEDCVAINNGQHGFGPSGDVHDGAGVAYAPGSRPTRRITLRRCHAEANPGNPNNTGNHSGSGIVGWAVDSLHVIDCTAYNNGGDMPRTGAVNGPVGIWAAECDDFQVKNSIAWGNKSNPDALDGGGFDFDGGCTNSLIEHCLAYDNQGPGLGMFQYSGGHETPWSNNIVRYSIFINNAVKSSYGEVQYWNGTNSTAWMKNGIVHSNVFYNSRASRYGIETTSAMTGMKFFNNIFWVEGQILKGYADGDSVWQGNLYWSTDGTLDIYGYTSVKAWSDAKGDELDGTTFVGVQGDPVFVGPLTSYQITDPAQLDTLGAYKLSSTSPAINKGIDLAAKGVTVPATDFFGLASKYGTAYDIGAHEYGGTVTNTDPDWQKTGVTRCQQDASGNTGYIEEEEKDMNPDSATYNTTRWVLGAYDTASCPLPSTETVTFATFGSNGYVTIEDSSTWNSEPDPITMVARFRTTTTADAVIFEHGDNTTNLFAHVKANGQLYAGSYSTHAYFSDKGVNDGNWHEVVIAHNATSTATYIWLDKVLVFAQDSNRARLTSGKEWTIGSRYGASMPLLGDIDYVQMHTTFFTQADVDAISEDVKASMLVNLKFDVSPIADSTANAWLIKTYNTVTLGTETGSSTVTDAVGTPHYAAFDAVDDRIDLGSIEFDVSAGFTVMFWARRNAGDVDTSCALFLGPGATVNNTMQFMNDTSGFMAMKIYDTTTGVGLHTVKTAYNALVNDVWAHWAFVIEADGTGRIYKDGTLLVSTAGVGIPSSMGRDVGIIGALQTDSTGLYSNYNAFDTDEVIIWGTPRTAAQITADMNGYTEHQTGMVRYFKLNNNANDLSASQRNGTIVGGLTFVAN